MKKNVGTLDKIARIVIGAILIGMASTGMIGVWGWVGVVPLVTGLLGNCPLYALLGISTCKPGT